MKCLICGRKLKNPKSRGLGYGPICYKRKFGITPYTNHRDADTRVPTGADADYNIPGQMSIEEYLQMLLGQ